MEGLYLIFSIGVNFAIENLPPYLHYLPLPLSDMIVFIYLIIVIVLGANDKSQLFLCLAIIILCFLGSLMNLAKHPSSTVQILGAEKALFRQV